MVIGKCQNVHHCPQIPIRGHAVDFVAVLPPKWNEFRPAVSSLQDVCSRPKPSCFSTLNPFSTFQRRRPHSTTLTARSRSPTSKLVTNAPSQASFRTFGTTPSLKLPAVAAAQIHHGAAGVKRVPEYPLQPACDAPVRRPSSFSKFMACMMLAFSRKRKGVTATFRKESSGRRDPMAVRPNAEAAKTLAPQCDLSPIWNLWASMIFPQRRSSSLR